MRHDRSTGMLRRCGVCGSWKPGSDFAWRKRAKGWYDNMYRPCRSAYKKQHYAKNKQRYVDNATARNARATWPRDKEFSVTEGLRNRKWADVLAEIDKCVVRCANCHRRRTAEHPTRTSISLPG